MSILAVLQLALTAPAQCGCQARCAGVDKPSDAASDVYAVLKLAQGLSLPSVAARPGVQAQTSHLVLPLNGHSCPAALQPFWRHRLLHGSARGLPVCVHLSGARPKGGQPCKCGARVPTTEQFMLPESCSCLCMVKLGLSTRGAHTHTLTPCTVRCAGRLWLLHR